MSRVCGNSKQGGLNTQYTAVKGNDGDVALMEFSK